MRLVVWNCNMALHRKIDAVLGHCHSNWMTGDKRFSIVVGCRKRHMPAIDFREKLFNMLSSCIFGLHSKAADAYLPVGRDLDDPETLSCEIKSTCPTGADVRQCGLGVPLFDYREDRPNLPRYWTAQGIDKLRKYWGLKNMQSIDGLPTHFVPDAMVPVDDS